MRREDIEIGRWYYYDTVFNSNITYIKIIKKTEGGIWYHWIDAFNNVYINKSLDIGSFGFKYLDDNVSPRMQKVLDLRLIK